MNSFNFFLLELLKASFKYNLIHRVGFGACINNKYILSLIRHAIVTLLTIAREKRRFVFSFVDVRSRFSNQYLRIDQRLKAVGALIEVLAFNTVGGLRGKLDAVTVFSILGESQVKTTFVTL